MFQYGVVYSVSLTGPDLFIFFTNG